WPTAVNTIEHLKPDVYAKGSDYADASRDLTGMIVEEQRAVAAGGGRVVYTDEQTFSSSSLINEHFSNLPPAADAYLRTFRQRHSADEVLTSLRGVANMSVLVVGEAIIDEYCYCVPL